MKSFNKKMMAAALSGMMLSSVFAADVFKAEFSNDAALKDWQISGEKAFVAAGAEWQTVQIKFNSRNDSKVFVHLATLPKAIGSVWFDNLRISPSEGTNIPNADFEEKKGWTVVGGVYDKSNPSHGLQCIAARARKPTDKIVVQQDITVKPNTEYVLSVDVIIGDKFKGQGRLLVFNSKHNGCIVKNYNDALFTNIIKKQKKSQALQLTATDKAPASLKRVVDLGGKSGILNFAASIDTSKFKGTAKIELSDGASGEKLDTVNIIAGKNGWQKLSTSVDFPSKVNVALTAAGTGSIIVKDIKFSEEK